MKSLKTLKNLKGKTALVRVDFNVPIRDGKILDDFRIKKALPTINYLRQKGAKIILISHLGKESGRTLKPVMKYLDKLKMKNVVLMENLLDKYKVGSIRRMPRPVTVARFPEMSKDVWDTIGLGLGEWRDWSDVR